MTTPPNTTGAQALSDEKALFEAWVASEAGPNPGRSRVADCRMAWLGAISALGLPAQVLALSSREQAGAVAERGPRVEHLCRAICAYIDVNPDQVLDYTDGKPSKLAWHRHDMQAARLLRELDALAAPGAAIAAREQEAPDVHSKFTRWYAQKFDRSADFREPMVRIQYEAFSAALASREEAPAEKHCSDERPCTPCFIDKEACEEAPASSDKPDDHVWVKCPVCQETAHQHFDWRGFCPKCQVAYKRTDGPPQRAVTGVDQLHRLVERQKVDPRMASLVTATERYLKAEINKLHLATADLAPIDVRALKTRIAEILVGIDKDEGDGGGDGWWPTSHGVTFGTERLIELMKAVDEAIPGDKKFPGEIDYTIKCGDLLTNGRWTLTDLIVVDLNWAIRAVALRLGERGGIVVWPLEGLTKVIT